MNIEIFTAQGTKPLGQLLTMSCPRLVKREYDKSCRSNVVTLEGTTPTQCNVQFLTPSVQCTTPVIMVQMNCNPGDVLLELVVLDGASVKRRVTFTNSVKGPVMDCFHTRLPLAALPRGVWCNVYIHLGALLERHGFLRLEKIALGPALKLRRIYALRDIPCEPPKGAEFPPGVPVQTMVIAHGDECTPSPSPTPQRAPGKENGKEKDPATAKQKAPIVAGLAFGRRVPVVTPRSQDDVHGVQSSRHADASSDSFLQGAVPVEEIPLATPRDSDVIGSVQSSPGIYVAEVSSGDADPQTVPKAISPERVATSGTKGYDPKRYSPTVMVAPTMSPDRRPPSSVHTSQSAGGLGLRELSLKASQCYSVKTGSSVESYNLEKLRDAIPDTMDMPVVTVLRPPLVREDPMMDPKETSLVRNTSAIPSVDVSLVSSNPGGHRGDRYRGSASGKIFHLEDAPADIRPITSTSVAQDIIRRSANAFDQPSTRPTTEKAPHTSVVGIPPLGGTRTNRSSMDVSSAFVVQYGDPSDGGPAGEEEGPEVDESHSMDEVPLGPTGPARYDVDDDSPADVLPPLQEGSEATEDIVPSTTSGSEDGDRNDYDEDDDYEEEREEYPSGEYETVDISDKVVRHLNFSGDTTVLSVDIEAAVARELNYSNTTANTTVDDCRPARYGAVQTSQVFDHVLGMYYNTRTNTYSADD